jgi:hypothetical protein
MWSKAYSPNRKMPMLTKFPISKRPIISIGQTFGCLTSICLPYHIEDVKLGKHRRQHVDCICKCGKTKTKIRCDLLKRDIPRTFCSTDCKFHDASLPRDVPESSKLCKVGDVYGNFTILKEAFYHKEKGDINRAKYVEAECKCGKIKIYREDKIVNGKYKSCGCVWESKEVKTRSWSHIEKTYGLSKDDFYKILESQNGVCKICKCTQGSSKSDFLYVDHCHNTQKVRGLLCDKCNRGLGFFNEDITLFASAIEYLT